MKKKFSDVKVGDTIYVIPHEKFDIYESELRLPKLVKIVVTGISIVDTKHIGFNPRQIYNDFLPGHIDGVLIHASGVRIPKSLMCETKVEGINGICLADKEAYNNLLKYRLDFELKRIDRDIAQIEKIKKTHHIKSDGWFKNKITKINNWLNAKINRENTNPRRSK